MSRRDMAKKSGLMAQSMSALISMEWSMGTVFTNGPMEAFIKAIGTKTKYLVMVSTIGTMEGHTRGTGSKIICTDKVSILGLMEESTKVNTWMTKSTATEYTLTQMEGLTKDNGLTASNMVREFL
jgi:hypothetical protein